MLSDLSRSIPEKPILFMDFDQTIRNGGGTSGLIINHLYALEEKRGMTKEELNEIGRRAREENKLGLYNYFLAICNYDLNEFNELCDELFTTIDYKQVQKDHKLFKLLKKVSKKYNLYILTNNHKTHVDICCKKMFNVGLADMDFIKCYDITETYEDGCFHRKQDEGQFEKICQRVGADISECILIDDNKKVINTAKSVGMRGIRVKKNKRRLIDILKILKEL